MKLKNYQRFLDDDFDAVEYEKIKSKNNDHSTEDPPARHSLRPVEKNIDFRCVQCKTFVSADRAVCGVNNRNHCPHCLWSRHVDLHKPGDRRADCRSRMQPIGLTIKQTLKKYGGEKQGELMLIHRCTACGKLSINRIAADDDAHRIFEIFQASFGMDLGSVEKLKNEGIVVLGGGDTTAVYARLFGWQGIVDGFVDPVPSAEIIALIELPAR
jgi:predicted RNA-binding Zn-ribbon protein involved in translation (DUF1610 family)